MHMHHIIPRHAGGTDDPSNLVELTVEEHAEAHRVLYEKHGRWQDKLAWHGLSGWIGREKIIKEKCKLAALNNPHTQVMATEAARLVNTGRPQSEEHKRKKARAKYRPVIAEGKYYGSCKAAAEGLGISKSAIAQRLNQGYSVFYVKE